MLTERPLTLLGKALGSGHSQAVVPRMVKGLLQRSGLNRNYKVPLSAKVFSSWDFCIHMREAAIIKKHEISNEFKVCAKVGVTECVPVCGHFTKGASCECGTLMIT